MLWVPYGLLIVCMNLVKLAGWLRVQPPAKYRYTIGAILDFFFGDTATGVSTAIIISFELLLGAVYIDKMGNEIIPWVASLPRHWTLACVLALLSEGVAPVGIKAIRKRIYPDS